MTKLTRLEQEVYEFITDYIRRRGYAPSFRDIAEGMYISVSVAHKYCYRLQFKGVIAIEEKISRSIRIVK